VGKFGDETDTLDSTGNITYSKDCSLITNSDIEAVLPKFRGDILQVPPMFSALNRNGSRLYELARVGITLEREARPVHCYDIKLISNSTDLPFFRLDIECGGGFYVRSVISDIAAACNGVAHMTELIRTKQGPFVIDECLRQEDWDYNNIMNKLKSCFHEELSP
jgi:tRNA pseudouridine55 synthase